MQPFQFASVPSIIFGQSVADAISNFCQIRQISRVLLITDANIVGLGLASALLAQLESINVSVVVFADVEADPCETTVLRATETATVHKAQLVVGFGGGSSMDVAKVVAVLSLSSCEQTLANLYGVDNVLGGRLPLILVPTTAGTGSEVTPISIITTGGTTKAGIVSNKLLADAAILDPQLTIGLPPAISAATGIDAMVHAIEAFTSRIKKNPISDGLALNALTKLSKNIRTVVLKGDDLSARGAMLLGSLLAGQAFANAPVGGVHALAYPLGGHFHIPHGLSNALMLPHVLSFNLDSAVDLYAQLADVVCDDLERNFTRQQKAQHLIHHLRSLIVDLGLPTRLRECGVGLDSLPQLAKDAMAQQRLLINNPIEIDYQAALSIYQKAF
ncbi:iron-containing alcohol dehydrogenase [Aliiglaciecola litoralis]|uniref:Iron-containing alcohol dehydrogenase n=1 Tax=Aliiglaciecola litoralis TaxID=582857 RepID=A0ABN1LIF2_9ALTE